MAKPFMRLALIINIWGDWRFLEHSLRVMRPLVDEIIIVGSEYSNHKEYCQIPLKWYTDELHIREPQFNQALHSETDKRNFGLRIAKDHGCTHFLTADADEIYEPGPFLKEKDRFLNSNIAGLVCHTQVYFGSPKLTIGFDGTLVPFIHRLTPNIQHEFNKNYPFSWEGRKIRIDPSRSMNINRGVEYSHVICHHYSWCRGDYQKKIRNSTARANLERSTILKDLLLAKEGGFCEYYQKTLVRAGVDFEIPEYEFNQSSQSAIR